MFFISLINKNYISSFSLHYDYHMTTRLARGSPSFPRFLSGNRQLLPSLQDFSSRSIKWVFSMFTAPLLLNQKVTFQRLRPQFSQKPSKWTHYFNNLPCQHHQLPPCLHHHHHQDSHGKSEGVPEVDALIKSKALLVISKTFCPHCKRTKQVFGKKSFF